MPENARERSCSRSAPASHRRAVDSDRAQQPPDPAQTLTATVHAAVFDLGGVLVDWNPRRLYRKLLEDDAAVEAFLAEICTQEWNAQQDLGRPWSEAVESLARQHPGHRRLIAAYRDRWEEMLGGPIEETVAVLAELRAVGLPLYALSNWSAETFPIARSRYGFLDWFTGIVISGEVRLGKPDPRAFSYLLDRYGLEAGTTVFIDDSERNIAAAAELGMIAIRFQGGQRLRADLAALGLLPREAEPTRAERST
jgi:2-haloacid dehalogenase